MTTGEREELASDVIEELEDKEGMRDKLLVRIKGMSSAQRRAAIKLLRGLAKRFPRHAHKFVDAETAILTEDVSELK